MKKIKASKATQFLKEEITPAVEDLFKHNFNADKRYKKLVTDITEFHIPAGKIYLSPIIDLYDGSPITWTISTSPKQELTNEMLLNLFEILPKDTHPIIHSDRGIHYKTNEWIEMMNDFGYVRSMSKKGCSPDNAACEGYFGTLKKSSFIIMIGMITQSKDSLTL